jgi:hypothetical protein
MRAPAQRRLELQRGSISRAIVHGFQRGFTQNGEELAGVLT